MAGILIAILVFWVTLNIDGAFPSFDNLPDLVQALILGFMTGLFSELGKFIILDRMMPAVRNRESGLLFGMGWSGVGIILTGFFLIFGVFGMQNLLNTKDFSTVAPNADQNQIQFLQQSQQQLQQLVSGSPFKAVTPLFESVALFILDMAMTLLIIFGLNIKQTRYVWLAVGIRTVLSTLMLYFTQTGTVPVEFVFVGWMIVGAAVIYYVQKMIKRSPV